MNAPHLFSPTRTAGLKRLTDFMPRAGALYARDRNTDFGPNGRSNVSQLSPWLRHRLITKREVTAEVLAQHSFAEAEKSVQEVLWRTYRFDDWARELVDPGYLHHHARMWFAWIWIFTLRLPWTLGADFFMRHLLDGDPASNTLS